MEIISENSRYGQHGGVTLATAKMAAPDVVSAKTTMLVGTADCTCTLILQFDFLANQFLYLKINLHQS